MKISSMTDSMKFGPEWLRNLSADGNTGSSSGGGTRYHLAEHRYGREEMLALFEQSLKLRPPASMMNFPTLYVDQALNPLALAPMTEDENRLWSRGAVPPGAPRGRGGSMDRGRGRGRGGTFHPSFSRSSSTYDEPVRSYDRTQSDRGWQERNGDMSSDWGGSSPRKEYNLRSTSSDNWRRHRDDEEGWRTASHGRAPDRERAPPQDKWSGQRSTGSWRNDGDEDRGASHLSDRQANARVSWHSSSDNGGPRGAPHRRPWDAEDHLPEWATENPSESGGTFDSTGAFHGSDEESELRDPKSDRRNKEPLQKSASQHNITSPKKPPPLATSQSAMNLHKKAEDNGEREGRDREKDREREREREVKREVHREEKKEVKEVREVKEVKEIKEVKEEKREEEKVKKVESGRQTNNRVDDEFEHMKEVTNDLVAKLITEDDSYKTNISEPQPARTTNQIPGFSQVPAGLSSVLGGQGGLPMPPPGTVSGIDKWFYRDPQGEVQGPFSATEMAEWFRAGYFTVSLLVRRQCDERYFTLGDLVKQCPGGVPFLNCRIPPLKAEPPAGPVAAKTEDPLIHHQLHMQRLLQRQAEAVRVLSQTEPWAALSPLQQRELITQHMMTQPNLTDVPYVPQMQNTQISNPLMLMINQMAQANKLPTQPAPMVDKPPNSLPTQQLDPLQQLVQQMGGMQPNIAPSVPIIPQQNATMENQQTDDPIKNFLRQLAGKPQVLDSMWSQTAYQQPPQWMGNQQMPMSLWDLHGPTPPVPPPVPTPTSVAQQQAAEAQQREQEEKQRLEKERQEKDKEKEAQRKAELEKEQKMKEKQEAAEKERKRKEQEQQEKIKQQKEAEERRKEEQRKKEAEKKAEVEKQKKEEERIKKELEKAKKEAEEKRLRELEEKRRLKEQRKAEEEARKKAEEDKKRDEDEKQRREVEKREEQARRQAEALRKMQEQQQQQAQRTSKVPPWGQNVVTPNVGGTNLTLAEIQRIEREKKAQEAALLQQQRATLAAKELQEQQAQAEKNALQLGWAKKATGPKKIKSLAEIQAEEQEKLAKQLAEQRAAQMQKEKESVLPAPAVGIWGAASQSLTWNSNQNQWSSQNTGGFWDEAPPVQKSPVKPTVVVAQPQQKVTNVAVANKTVIKSKAKKEEAQVMKLFDKNSSNDEFTAWCNKTLATLNSEVDIPTFVGFLRDIESPYEVKDYVRQYLGDNAQAAQFANQFVERRSRARDRQRAALQHKDDLNTPAPAINPTNTDFQEVKGKGKKSKKNKMVKLDNTALGFNVIAAQDRINVGDRDYGDNL